MQLAGPLSYVILCSGPRGSSALFRSGFWQKVAQKATKLESYRSLKRKTQLREEMYENKPRFYYERRYLAFQIQAFRTFSSTFSQK